VVIWTGRLVANGDGVAGNLFSEPAVLSGEQAELGPC
jgi:hypothetical protein